MKENNLFWIIAFIFIILSIIMYIGYNITSTSTQPNQEKQVITSEEVVNEIIEILKNNRSVGYDAKNILENYLSDDFSYVSPDNYNSKFARDFLSDVGIFFSSYETEKRGDISQDNTVTYRIYWNIVEENKARGVNKAERGYCLQTINIYLKKVTKENLITYEVERIILNNA